MYPGFKFIGKLPSINEQRLIQKKVLENILLSKRIERINFLSVGVGDGEELNFLLTSPILKSSIAKVICIDILNSYFNPYSLPNVRDMNNKITFVQEDARNLHKHLTQAEFDIIQCGFLMHEIKYEDKNNILLQFFNLLKPAGYLVYSDIFTDNYKQENPHEDLLRVKNIERLYKFFIEEATECVKNGVMTQTEWDLLYGDGVTEGLIKSMERDMEGLDSYYEPLDKAKSRLIECGYRDIETYGNQKNDYLFVISAKRLGGL